MAAAIEIHGMTRSAFLARGALALGGAYGASAVAPFVAGALAAEAGGDVAIFNFALTLERLEVAFYTQAVKAPGLSPEVKKALTEIAAHEQEHAKAIQQAIEQLGAQPVPAPKAKFPSLNGEGALLKLAITLEDTGVGAYNGAAGGLQSPDLLAAAGSIVQVEARHAGALRELAGQQPAVGAFDPALTQADVLNRVKPYVQS